MLYNFKMNFNFTSDQNDILLLRKNLSDIGVGGCIKSVDKKYIVEVCKSKKKLVEKLKPLLINNQQIKWVDIKPQEEILE